MLHSGIVREGAKNTPRGATHTYFIIELGKGGGKNQLSLGEGDFNFA